MTDKLGELQRINGSRVNRLLEVIGYIEKSANSMRAHEIDIAKLMLPVVERMASFVDDDALEAIGAPQRAAEAPPAPTPAEKPSEPSERAVSPPVARKLERYRDLPITDLIDIALACAVEIAARRK